MLVVPPTVVVVAFVAEAVYVSVTGLSPDPLLVATFAGQGAMAAVYWIFAFWLSSGGDPLWIAGGGVVPNLAAVVASTFVMGAPSATRVLVIVAAQLVGFALSVALVVMSRPAAWRSLRSWRPAEGDEDGRRAGRWYLSQGVAGYGSLLALQSFVGTLPTHSLSILGVLFRAQGGLTSIVTNANLPALVNSESTSGDRVERFLSWVAAATALVVSLMAVLQWSLVDALWPTYVGIVIVWFATSTLNAAGRRVGARFLSPSSPWSPSACASPYRSPCWRWRRTGSLAVLLVAYIVLEAVPGLTYGCVLRWFKVVAAYSVVVVAGVLVLLPFLSESR